MCDYCKKHAKNILDNNPWYLNPECYSEKISMTKDRIKVYNQIIGYTIEYYFEYTNRMLRLQNKKIPFLGRIGRKYGQIMAPKLHAGQIVTLEDAKKIVDLSEKHVLLPCGCRTHSGGYEEYTCLNFGTIKDLTEKAAPEWNIQEISRSEAHKQLEEWEKKGYYHQTLWAKQPYVICLCNCDPRSCIPRKQRMIFNMPSALLKGHEIAVSDHEICDGCSSQPVCINKCPFNAIKYDQYQKSVSIDPIKCFGCGLCRSACEQGAIKLIPRSQNITAKNEW